VSVYIIRVHCPYYIIGLDTFYGLARNLKLHKSKVQKIPKFLHSKLCMNFKVQEMKLKLKDEICS
jgi:hypothetical protein